MEPQLRLNAVTRAQRNTLISQISDAVATSGGWIDDVHFFSNISVALRFVIPAKAGFGLDELFTSQPMQIDPDDRAKLAGLSARDENEEIICTLQITFFHDDPDLRRPIPSIPG